eukprot:3083071-Lingulodinium_polyedra.AAC.1
MPWNSVIRAAARAGEFWDKELKEPALEWKLSGGRQASFAKGQLEEEEPLQPGPRRVRPRGGKRAGAGQPGGGINSDR